MTSGDPYLVTSGDLLCAGGGRPPQAAPPVCGGEHHLLRQAGQSGRQDRVSGQVDQAARRGKVLGQCNRYIMIIDVWITYMQ